MNFEISKAKKVVKIFIKLFNHSRGWWNVNIYVMQYNVLEKYILTTYWNTKWLNNQLICDNNYVYKSLKH